MKFTADSCTRSSVNKTSQGLLSSANSPTNIAVNQSASSMLLPNAESQAPAGYDQLALEDVTTIAVDQVEPVSEATTASTTTEEGQEQPEMPATLAPVEESAAIEV